MRLAGQERIGPHSFIKHVRRSVPPVPLTVQIKQVWRRWPERRKLDRHARGRPAPASISAGPAPSPAGWPPRCLRSSRDSSGQATALDHLVMERTQQDAVLGAGLAAVGLVLGVVHLAGRGGLVAAARPTGSAGPAASPRCGSRPGSSRRTRCPAAGSARPAGRRAAGGAGSCASPPGPDSRSTALPMTACSSAAQAASRAPSRRRAVQFHAQPDQVLERVDVDVAGHDGGHRRVAGDAPRRRRRPARPRRRCRSRTAAARCAAHRARTCAVHCSCSGGAAVQAEQVGQGDVRPHLDRLPGPLRQQVTGRDQPAHGLRPARRDPAAPWYGHLR